MAKNPYTKIGFNKGVYNKLDAADKSAYKKSVYSKLLKAKKEAQQGMRPLPVKGERPKPTPRPLPVKGERPESRMKPLPHYPGEYKKGLPEGFKGKPIDKARYSKAFAKARSRISNTSAVGQGYSGLGAVEMNKRKAQHTAMADIAKAKHQEASSRLTSMTGLIGAHGSDPAFMMQHGQSVLDSAKDAQKKMTSAARDYSLWYNRGKKFRK